MQERRNFIANALELRLPCTNPWKCYVDVITKRTYSLYILWHHASICYTGMMSYNVQWHIYWNYIYICIKGKFEGMIFQLLYKCTTDSYTFKWTKQCLHAERISVCYAVNEEATQSTKRGVLGVSLQKYHLTSTGIPMMKVIFTLGIS